VVNTSQGIKDIKLWNEHNKLGAHFKFYFINLSDMRLGSPTEDAEDRTV